VRFGFAAGKGHPALESLPLGRLTEHQLVESSRTLLLLPIVLRGEALGLGAFAITNQLAETDLLETVRELFATVLKVTQTRHG
jgi:hypothetical protein